MILNYSDFNKTRTIHFFDFDDTLVLAPKYLEMAGELVSSLRESVVLEVSLDDLIRTATTEIGVDIKDLKVDSSGMVYVEDPTGQLAEKTVKEQAKKNWQPSKSGLRLYLHTPDRFNKSKISLGDKPNHIISDYKENADRAAIVTARHPDFSNLIEGILKSLNLPIPKLGIHYWQGMSQGRVEIWKPKKIEEIIKQQLAKGEKLEQVIFWEDSRKNVNEYKKYFRSNPIENIQFVAKIVRPSGEVETEIS